jgi:uncharacterized protein
MPEWPKSLFFWSPDEEHTMTETVTPNPAAPALPWWRFGMVWMVIAGPALVVVAACVTGYIAMSQPDPLVAQDYYRRGIDINKTLSKQQGTLAPAVQARNHAATPRPSSPEKPNP